MGEVLLAHDTRLERLVALKLMSAELARDPVQRKRFHNEARAASGLSHPHICVIHEVGEAEDGRPFLAMEYVEGETLDKVLQQRRLAVREVLSLGIQVADALAAAHDRKIIHRDVKPSNIILDKRGRAKVLDFGLAKRTERDQLRDTNAVSTAYTQAGALIGTPHYMSPEQALGHELDHRSDIFSLGVVLHEMISGERPFPGKTVGEVINNVINKPPGPLGLVNPAFTPAVDKIILKCLEKEPTNRYPSASALAKELAELKERSQRPAPTPASDRTIMLNPVSTVGEVLSPIPPSKITTNSEQLWMFRILSIAGLLSLLLLAAESLFQANTLAIRLTIALAAILTGGAGFSWYYVRTRTTRQTTLATPSSPTPTAPTQKSLAVLPFDNFSAETNTDYLSDGLTEEITSALARIPGLKVAARNSAFTFKGRHEDARKIGEVLHVTMLLQGSVRKAAQQIRVTVQLVSVADGYNLWSETFDRDVGDVIAVQDDIARRIAERLQMEIGAATRAAMAQRTSINPEAHVLYLQARHAWNKRTRESLEQALQLFRQAIDKDPAYADAHAGLAATYVVLPGYAYRPATEYIPLARQAAMRALEIDPTSAEAHAVLGDVATYARRFEEAFEHFRRAIELNPNYATGHQWYGTALMQRKRMDEALVEFRKAEELDPLSPIIRSCIPEWYYFAGRNEEAIEQVQRALQVFPEFRWLRKLLAAAYIRAGKYQEAMAEVNLRRAGAENHPAGLDMLSFCHARLGNETEAHRILRELKEWQGKGYDLEAEIAYAHVGLREYDQAVEALRRFVVSDTHYEEMFYNPLVMNEMHGHSGFIALMRELGLECERQQTNRQRESIEAR